MCKDSGLISQRTQHALVRKTNRKLYRKYIVLYFDMAQQSPTLCGKMKLLVLNVAVHIVQ